MGTSTAAPFTGAELEAIRAQFPILQREVQGHPLVYLDSAATAQKPQRVIDAESSFYATANAAVHRGAHTLAGEATELYEDARLTIARFLHVDENEVVFTSHATEALNLIAYALGNASLGMGGAAAAPYALRPGDEIVTTELEHHANLIPWQELAARTGATLRHIPVRDDGALDVEVARSVIGERTRVLALSHVSNVTGQVSPLAQLVPLARAVGALVVLDSCQAAPHVPLHPRELDVDLAVFSGHKLYGPTGIGVLYGRAEVLDALPPFLYGGSMITTVTMEKAEYLPSPQRFEPGTPRIAQAIGLAEAVRFVDELGLDRIAASEHARRAAPARRPRRHSRCATARHRPRRTDGRARERRRRRRARARRRAVPRRPRHRRPRRPPLRPTPASAARRHRESAAQRGRAHDGRGGRARARGRGGHPVVLRC